MENSFYGLYTLESKNNITELPRKEICDRNRTLEEYINLTQLHATAASKYLV